MIGRAALDRIFRARSVAVVGASANPHKLTGAPLAILQQTGFGGTIYPINPRYPEIAGLRCWPSVDALPAAPDVAVVLLPARDVVATLDALGRKGCKAAVVISSGFEEAADAAARVNGVRETCERHGIALVGPNCEGVWSVRSRVMLTFGSAARRDRLHHAPVAILSQSGSFAGGVARQLQESGFGCSYVVSVGNETILGVADYLDWLIEQDDVRVVLLFVEGLRHGSRLPALAERARRKGITLVALKSGNSAIGQEAVASHTGRIATPHAVYRDVFEQCGVIMVGSLTELVEAAQVLTTQPLPRRATGRSGGITVFSVPGGTRAHTADLCEAFAVPLATFEEETESALEARLPEFGVSKNPTDLTGHLLSDPGMFSDTLDVVAADPNTEALLVQLANRGPRDAETHRGLMAEVAKRHRLPVMVTFLGDVLPRPLQLALAKDGLCCARDPLDAVRYLSWLYRARENADRAAGPAPAAANGAAILPVPTAWRSAADLLESCGVGVPGWRILDSGGDPAASCAGLAWPLVLKALPEDADHKTELGLVKLGIASPEALAAEAQAMRARMGRPNAALLVQEMVRGGVELVLSVTRNRDFGAVLAIGAGGVLVELLRDVRHLCLPTTEAAVRDMVSKLRVAPLLAGYRGAPPCDVGALAAAAVQLGQWFLASGAAELEVNPLLAMPAGRGVVALDVLVKPDHGGSRHG